MLSLTACGDDDDQVASIASSVVTTVDEDEDGNYTWTILTNSISVSDDMFTSVALKCVETIETWGSEDVSFDDYVDVYLIATLKSDLAKQLEKATYAKCKFYYADGKSEKLEYDGDESLSDLCGEDGSYRFKDTYNSKNKTITVSVFDYTLRKERYWGGSNIDVDNEDFIDDVDSLIDEGESEIDNFRKGSVKLTYKVDGETYTVENDAKKLTNAILTLYEAARTEFAKDKLAEYR